MADINDINAGGNDVAARALLVNPAPGLWVRQAIDNMGWIDLGGELVVVDTLEQAELEGEVFRLIEESSKGLPVTTVVNTHSHIDHIALNKAFRRRHGANIVSFRTGDVPPGGHLVLDGSIRKVEVHHMPGCHTAEDCVVWVADGRVLFTGDLFGWGLVPYNGNLRPGQATLIRATYERLIAFAPDKVVPGHGPVCTGRELSRWLEYFDWLCMRLKDLYEHRMTLEDALREVQPPPDMLDWWRFVAWKHGDSVKKVFKAVKKGWV